MVPYSSHLIVIFDRSGSMGEPFRADYESARRASIISQHSVKILAAKAELIKQLYTDVADFVTIIPFHSTVDTPISGFLPSDLSEIEARVNDIEPGNTTMLALALRSAVEVANAESSDDIDLNCLIITDGLSHTRDEDIAFRDRIRTDGRIKGLSAILIDPTPKGQMHLSRLCKGLGLVIPVSSREQLDRAISERGEDFLNRQKLGVRHSQMLAESDRISAHLKQLERRLQQTENLGLEELVHTVKSEFQQEVQEAQRFKEQEIENYGATLDKEKTESVFHAWKNALANVNSLIQGIESLFSSRPPTLQLSVVHPVLLSKKYSSPFKVMLYAPEERLKVREQLKQEFAKRDMQEYVDDTDLIPGLTVIIGLTGRDIEFSKPVTKKLRSDINKASFIAKPKENCYPGEHFVKLFVTDRMTGEELISETLEVEVEDFAFDHVSILQLHRASSFTFGLIALILYLLTWFGQISETLGFVFGTLCLAIAGFISWRHQIAYHQTRSVVSVHATNGTSQTIKRPEISRLAIVAMIAGILLALVWMIAEPGFEPLLAIIGGLGTAGSLGQAKSSKKIDFVFSAMIVSAFLVGSYLIVRSLAPTPTPTMPQASATLVRESDDAVMLYVPTGEFVMGGDENADEKPIHRVFLDAFWIDRTEVTNAQYRTCVEAGACQAPTTCAWGDPTYNDGAKADHPVVCVSWHDATAYCQWAGARLPTEAEWEKAARGTDGRTYPWGNTFDGSKVNFCDRNCEFAHKDVGADDGYARTAPVGIYPAGASPCGALDLAGNVWEWVADWYDDGYYADSPESNPKGPNSGDYRVLRGGSWDYGRSYVRAAYRYRYCPDRAYYFIGFRCAADSPRE